MWANTPCSQKEACGQTHIAGLFDMHGTSAQRAHTAQHSHNMHVMAHSTSAQHAHTAQHSHNMHVMAHSTSAQHAHTTQHSHNVHVMATAHLRSMHITA